MLPVMPQRLKGDLETRLVQEEWVQKVCLADELDDTGGVALVPKRKIPDVLRQIGMTRRPAAIVTTQTASELMLGAASCREIYCTLQVWAGDRPTRHWAKRYLIQLGMGEPVRMEVGEEVDFDEIINMTKVTLRFDHDRGWDPTVIKAGLVAEYLKSHVGEQAFDSIVVRRDGSATARVFANRAEQLFRQSGREHIYSKPNPEENWNLEVLWMDASVTHKEILKIACGHVKAIGVAKKQSRENARFGLRFRNKADLMEAAEKYKLTEQIEFGRYKITGIRDASGPIGVTQMMRKTGWVIDEVLYVGDGHAMVFSKTCPKKNRFTMQQDDGTLVAVWVQAVDSNAKECFKKHNLENRKDTLEGMDWQTPGESLEGRLRPREPTGGSPDRRVWQKTQEGEEADEEGDAEMPEAAKDGGGQGGSG